MDICFTPLKKKKHFFGGFFMHLKGKLYSSFSTLILKARFVCMVSFKRYIIDTSRQFTKSYVVCHDVSQYDVTKTLHSILAVIPYL